MIAPHALTHFTLGTRPHFCLRLSSCLACVGGQGIWHTDAEREEYPIKHAVGVRLPSFFADGDLVTRVALSDVPVTHDQLRASFGLAALKQQGGIHAITLEFSDSRSYTTMNVVSSDRDTSVSLSGTVEQLQLKLHTPEIVAGSLKQEERSMSDLKFAMAIDFAVDVAQQVAPKTGPLKTGAEAQTLESVKAYLAMRKAVRENDLSTIRKVARFPQDFEGPEGAKFVKLMQSEEPSNIEVVEASQGNDTATLTVTGTKDGKPVRKTFDMQKKDGRWTTKNDNWEAN